MSIDGEKIDVQSNCEFDKWYTTTVKLSNQTSQIDFAFGKWSSIAISKIEITDMQICWKLHLTQLNSI